jgi:hypothetical protein
MPRHANARRLRLLGAVALSPGLSACAGTSPLALLVRAKDGVETISGNVLDAAASQIDSCRARAPEGPPAAARGAEHPHRQRRPARDLRGRPRAAAAARPGGHAAAAHHAHAAARRVPAMRPPPLGRSMPVTR